MYLFDTHCKYNTKTVRLQLFVIHYAAVRSKKMALGKAERHHFLVMKIHYLNNIGANSDR